LLDTSVAVALCVADHVGHSAAIEAVGLRPIGLPGHAWFETFSVLTRLPAPQRRTPSEVIDMMNANFPSRVFASESAQQRLIEELRSIGIAGGAIYDALVALGARQAGLPLLSADRRAIATYALLDVEVELVDY